MSISGIRDAIKTGLETISGLKAYDTVPDVIRTPCAFVLPKLGEYDFTASTSCYRMDMEITLLIGRQGDIQASQDAIDGYIAPAGAGSVKAAVEGADFGIHADSIRVKGFKDYGSFTFSGTQYLGVRFDVDVLV